jgi:TonB family protein
MMGRSVKSQMPARTAARRPRAGRRLAVHLLTASLIVPSAVVGQPVPIAAERLVDFQIAPQDLATALNRYSLATGTQLFYASRLAQGRASPGVIGRYSAQEALLVLLQGTGLRPRITAADAITLEPVDRPPSADGPEAAGGEPAKEALVLQLDTMHVEAQSGRASPLRYGFYAAAVRMEVGQALRRNARLRARRYRIQLSIWLAPDGRLAQSRMHKSSGDAGIDGAVAAALGTIVVRPSPPEGLPQPIHLDVDAMGA